MSRILSVRTPEGVNLDLEIATILQRVLAFSIDVCVMILIMLAFFLLASGGAALLGGGWSLAALIIAIFLLRNFYFTFFEILWSGRTIGKRLAMVKVVDIKGKPLSATAIFLRNVTRDLELFLPLQVVVLPESVWPGAPWWMVLVALLWVFLFAFYPFLNHRRARIGDLIAGTMVASIPKPSLSSDLSEIQTSNRFVFSAQQLDMYGVFELQTLEDLLHRNLKEVELLKVATVIAEKLDISKTKIDPARPFLEAFYGALRERHEGRLIFGDVQQTKKEGRYTSEDS